MALYESSDDSEGIDETQLIENLKTKGLEDPATLELLNQWTVVAETEADAIARGRGPLAEEARVNLELRRAHLYSQADGNPTLRECAQEAWADAIQLAEATQNETLIERVRNTALEHGYSV